MVIRGRTPFTQWGPKGQINGHSPVLVRLFAQVVFNILFQIQIQLDSVDISVHSLTQYSDFIQIQFLDSHQTQFDAATQNWNFIQISVHSPNFSARLF